MATPRHGKNTSFKMGTVGTPSVLVDVSSYLTNVSFGRSSDMADTTAFQATNKTSLPGIPDASLTLDGNWDPAFDAILSALLGSDVAVNIEYGPEGTATGRIRYTGSYYVAGYNDNSPVNDKVGVSVTLAPASAVARGTFP